MAVTDYDATADNNTSISGINIAEGCAPSGINNAIRQMMADIKTRDGQVVHTSGNETVAGTKTFSSAASVKGLSSTQQSALYRNADTGALDLFGGTNGNGARLRLSGTNRTGYEGWFTIQADDGNGNTKSLQAKPDGTLLWDSLAVERVAASSFAANSGYIRFASGLQIVWDKADVSNAGTGKDMTFPQAFSKVPVIVLTPSPASAASGTNAVIAYPRTTTGMTVYINKDNAHSTGGFNYVAIGPWA